MAVKWYQRISCRRNGDLNQVRFTKSQIGITRDTMQSIGWKFGDRVFIGYDDEIKTLYVKKDPKGNCNVINNRNVGYISSAGFVRYFKIPTNTFRVYTFKYDIDTSTMSIVLD